MPYYAAAAQEANDTVKVIENADRVIVERTGDTTSVEVKYNDNDTDRIFRYDVAIESDESSKRLDFPSDWGMDLPFVNIEPKQSAADSVRKNTVKRYFVGLNHLYFGWRFNYKGNAGIDNCFEYGIRNLIGAIWKRRGAEFETGFGISGRRYLASEGLAFVKIGDRLSTAPVPEGTDVIHSRTDILTLHVPLIYNQKIYRSLTSSIGAIVNFNTYADAYNELQTGNITMKNRIKGLHQNFLTVDAFAALQLDGIGIYATWSPMRAFDRQYGPELRSWSLGLELLF